MKNQIIISLLLYVILLSSCGNRSKVGYITPFPYSNCVYFQQLEKKSPLFQDSLVHKAVTNLFDSTQSVECDFLSDSMGNIWVATISDSSGKKITFIEYPWGEEALWLTKEYGDSKDIFIGFGCQNGEVSILEGSIIGGNIIKGLSKEEIEYVIASL